MKLNRLLRRMMVQPTNLTRGGGGIPRPDPPINNTYSHKRIITPFDQNMWMTCGSQPVYVFSNPEQFMQDHLTSFKRLSQQFPTILIVLTGSVTFIGLVLGQIEEHATYQSATGNSIIRNTENKLKNRDMGQGHFLFKELRFDDCSSNSRTIDENATAFHQMKDRKKSIAIVHQINTEAKNFADNLMIQAAAKVDKQLAK